MADYDLNLGFNWNSPPIGAVWSTESTSYRFLQYALADAGGAPAWFEFQENDTLYVQLWDLSSQAPPVDSFVLAMSLTALDAVEALDPTALLNLGDSASVKYKLVNDRSNPYLEYAGGTLSYNWETPYEGPWGPARGVSSRMGPVSFIRDASFKLSFHLTGTASLDGLRRTEVFISDPEVIVGSRG